jgi:hypothetical protein
METIKKINKRQPLVEIIESDFFSTKEQIEALTRLCSITTSKTREHRDFIFKIVHFPGKINEIAINELIEIGTSTHLYKLSVDFEIHDAYTKLEQRDSDKFRKATEKLLNAENEELRNYAFYKKYKDNTSILELLAMLDIGCYRKHKNGILKLLGEIDFDFDDKLSVYIKLNSLTKSVFEEYNKNDFIDIYNKITDSPELLWLISSHEKTNKILSIITQKQNLKNITEEDRIRLFFLASNPSSKTKEVAKFLAANNDVTALKFKQHLSKEEIEKLIENLNNKN